MATNSNRGTITDDMGSFTLEVPDGTGFLRISYTGYRLKEIPIEDEPILVNLDVSSTMLDQVTVIGYGTQKRADITGAISVKGASEIEGMPVSTLQSVLQTGIAGVQVTHLNGKLGQPINVRIRGTGSINATNEPMYVIDGVILTDQSRTFTSSNVPLNPLANLNTFDIEDITVLKDAAATAIYGARASNGVVLITTKKGKVGQQQLAARFEYGLSYPTNNRKWLNAEQYLTLWDEAFGNVTDDQGLVFGLSAQEWKDRNLPTWEDGYDTDWQSLIYANPAKTFEGQVSASGGNDKSSFYLSGGYLNQEGILLGNSLERINTRLNLTHTFKNNLDFGSNLSFSYLQNYRLAPDNNWATPGQIIAQPPVQPALDPDNPELYYENTIYPNPLLTRNNSKWTSTLYNTLGNLYLNWSPIPGVTWHSDLGLDFKLQDDDLWQGSRMVTINREPGGFAYTSFRTIFNYGTNHYLSLEKSVAKFHYQLTTGLSLQKENFHYNRVAGRNFPNDLFRNIQNAAEIFQGREWEEGWRNLSYFSRANFDFKEMYLLAASLRYEGDSRFGTDHRYGIFPSFSLGWIISEAPFYPEGKTFNYLKLRASYGITGNTPEDNFPYQGLYFGSQYAGLPATIQTSIANPDLRWERTAQTNLGMDVGFLNDRIFMQVDLYRKKTRDLLLEVNIPSTSGFETQLENIGKLENSGLEIDIQAYILTGVFKWKSSFQMAFNRNQVTDLNGQVIDSGFGNRVMEGEPMGVFFQAEYAGVDPQTGDALYIRNQQVSATEVDRSTTNNIAEANKVIVGNPHPDYTFSFSNQLRWRNISLDWTFQGVYGNQLYNYGAYWQMDGFSWFDNQDQRILARWKMPGEQTDVPQLRFLQNNQHSSRYVEDGSYIRLKNMTLNYQIPQNLTSRLGTSGLKVYVTANNIFTLTRYQGWDPEVRGDFLGSATTLGIDFYSIPQARTLLAGFQITF